MYKKRYGLMACLIVGLVSCAQASTPISLAHLLQQYHSFSANFTQVTTLGSGDQRQASGKLWIAKPNRFRWQVLKPHKQLYLSNGKQVWTCDQDLQQATVQPLSSRLQGTPALLMSGKITKLYQWFTVKKLGPKQFLLTPKKADSLLQSITLQFNTQKQFHRLMVRNTTGQVTQVTFENIQLNPVIAPSQFVFVPPKGVDVLRAQ